MSCGRLALWLVLLRAMGLRQELERLLPTEAVASHGAVLEALILTVTAGGAAGHLTVA